MSPFNAWVLLKGLETLPIRVRAQTETAGRLADHLAGLDGISRVLYPGRPDFEQRELYQRQMGGGSNMLSFEIAGGKAETFRFLNALKIIKISNNLGDAKSLITHPATTTHQRLTPVARAELGIGPSLVRLSVGLEAYQDLAVDIERALGCRSGT